MYPFQRVNIKISDSNASARDRALLSGLRDYLLQHRKADGSADVPDDVYINGEELVASDISFIGERVVIKGYVLDGNSYDLSGNGGGGSSNVLVVNATIDFEHAESERAYPLILDKTTDEIFAAEYTVLSVDSGAGVFILGEIQRGGEPLSRNIGWAWGSKLDDGSTFIAGGEEGYDGELDPKLYPIPASGGDEPLTIGVTVSMSGDDVVYTMDKTWSEIWTAVSANRLCVGFIDVGASTKSQIWVSGVTSEGGAYGVMVPDMSGGMMPFVASGESGYPIYTLQNGG